NSTAILVLMGWNHLKLNQLAAAQENFSRAARLDPGLIEARLGLAYLGVQSGQTQVRVEEIQALLAEDPRNLDYQLAAAAMLRQSGQNRQSAAIFRGMLGRDRYGEVARRNLEQMYGLENLNEEIPADLPPLRRSADLEVHFRAEGQYWQQRNGANWENFYIKGVNLGPAIPGKFVSEPPVLVEDYLRWFEQIASLGANTVRAFTMLPPAFYRALRSHNDRSPRQRLYLLQEVWLAESAGTNLFQSSVETGFQQEIAHALDALHGQGDIPMRPGYSGGLYAVDVSPDVVGLLIGREWEPHLVVAHNQANPLRSSYEGKFVSLEQGNAMEAWLAGMMDYAALYETQKYNHQTPLGVASWPALDPLSHPSEASLAEEYSFRRRLGEALTPPGPGEIIDDNDAVSVNDAGFQKRPELAAGLFASYSVFPYFPDFLYRDPAYLQTRDPGGPNPFLGYLRALKAHYRNMPLLAGAYGISTSLGIARYHPYGWSHGGLTEREQGAALARMTRNLADAGWAGGLITEWQDDWNKSSWLTRPLSIPFERQPLWSNKLDPDQSLGLWTYDPSGEAQFWSSFAGWNQVRPLYLKDRGPIRSLSDGWDTERTLRSLAVASDESFVYVRLQVGSVRADRNNLPDLRQAQYFIGISTAPGRFGSRVQPGLVPQVRSEQGANFLLHLGPSGARLLVASNYNPREVRPISGLPSNVALSYRIPFRPELDEWSG
ncbi:MAG: tetratricopeptide repeat protein, partial [Terriglobia bacterium]